MNRLKAELGDLTELISLVSTTLTGDGMGGATTAENVYAVDIWAKVTPLRATERQASERQEALADYVVKIRNRSDVSEGHFVRWNGRDLNITFVRNRSAREHFLEIECQAGKAV